MKKLNAKHVQELVAEMELAAQNGNWETWHETHVCQQALIEFPTGELWNPNILGFLWSWKMQDRIVLSPIAKGDSFSANGLEGKVSVQTCLTTALLVWRELSEHRRLLSLI